MRIVSILLIALASMGMQKPPETRLIVAPAVTSLDSKQVAEILRAHGISVSEEPGLQKLCGPTSVETLLCLGRDSQGLTLIAVRPQSAGGSGEPIRARLGDDLEGQVWSLWRRTRVARPVSGEQAGRVSIEGGPFRDLPVDVPYREAPVPLVVHLDGCPPFVQHLTPDVDRLTLACPDIEHRLHIRSSVVAKADVAIGEARVEASIDPNEVWIAPLPAGTDQIAITCRSPGMLDWATRIANSGRGDLTVTCKPEDAGRFVKLSTNIHGPVVHVDDRLLTTAAPLANPEEAVVLPVRPRALATMTSMQWMLIDVKRPGTHQICVTGARYERQCQAVHTTSGRSARLEITATRRPEPAVPQATVSEPSIHEREPPRSPWRIQGVSGVLADFGRDNHLQVSTEVMAAYAVGRWAFGLAGTMLGNKNAAGWGAKARLLFGDREMSFVLFVVHAFRQINTAWSTVSDVDRQVYTGELGLDFLRLDAFSLQLAGEAGAEERRTRDFQSARISTTAHFNPFFSARVGAAWTWQ